MISKYNLATISPDVDGSVFDDALGGSDIVFDWTPMLIPSGSCVIKSVGGTIMGTNGAAQNDADFRLYFAKSINGAAPSTMGDVNAAQTACFDLKDHYVGSAILESTAATGTISGTAFHVVYHGSDNSVTGGGLPLIIDLDSTSGTNVGYDKLYVMGFQMDARHYSTGVIFDGTVDASTDQSTTVTVKTVDATKIFSVGDQVYVHDIDSPIPGTLTKVEATTLTFSEANTTVDITDDDEAMNANPIRLKLGFEK